MFVIYVENVYEPEGIAALNIDESERILFTESNSSNSEDVEGTAGTIIVYPGGRAVYRGENALDRFNDMFEAFGQGQSVYDTREDIGYWHNEDSVSGSSEKKSAPKRRGRPPASESKEPATPPPSE